MKKPLVLLHSLSNLIEPASSLVMEMAPDIEVRHLLDETMWYELARTGKLKTNVVRRVCYYAAIAQEANAGAMLTTCSSLSPCFEVAQKLVDIPLIRLDLPVIERAISIGSRLGLVATSRSTVRPYSELVRKVADQKGVEANAINVYCNDALDAFKHGEIEMHDRIVLDTVCAKSRDHKLDVIVLCQASLHRVLPQLESRFDLPILSALPLALESAIDQLMS